MFPNILVASKVNCANYGGLYIRVDTPLMRLFIIDWHCGCTPSVIFPNCRLVMIFSSTMLSNSYVDWCVSLSYLPTHGLILSSMSFVTGFLLEVDGPQHANCVCNDVEVPKDYIFFQKNHVNNKILFIVCFHIFFQVVFKVCTLPFIFFLRLSSFFILI